MDLLIMYSLLKMGIFHCDVSSGFSSQDGCENSTVFESSYSCKSESTHIPCRTLELGAAGPTTETLVEWDLGITRQRKAHQICSSEYFGRGPRGCNRGK